jgi:four helix bundle protein
MKIEMFEDILAWQKAKILTNAICDMMEKNNDFGFRNQLCRATVSIMNNIAEGYERRTNKEFTQFLFIAKGSCGEVRSMLHLGLDRKYVSKSKFNELSDLSIEISKMLSGLIKSLK